MYKIEIQDERHVWLDVRDDDGAVLTFPSESEARAELERRYPVQTGVARYVGPQRTRVIAIWTQEQDDDWNT